MRRRSDANISLQESALPGFTNRHGPNRKQSDAINNFSDYVNCSSGAAEMLSCSGHIVDWMCQGERGTEHARQTKLLNPDLQEFRKPALFETDREAKSTPPKRPSLSAYSPQRRPGVFQHPFSKRLPPPSSPASRPSLTRPCPHLLIPSLAPGWELRPTCPTFVPTLLYPPSSPVPLPG